MAHIAVLKVRMPHDVEWHTGWWMRQALKLPGLGNYRRKLQDLEGKPFMPQLTLTYLAGLGQDLCAARGLRHSFEVLDERLEFVDVSRYDMLWLTVNTPNAFASYEVADRARAAGIPVVLGGVHPTLMREEAMRHATSVVCGEAEPVLGQLIDDFEAGQLQPLYRGRAGSELRGLSRPRWELMPPDYHRWVIPVQTSRGCRNACAFCATTRMQGARRRHRPVEEVVAEIVELRERGILTDEKLIFFTDNNIAYDDLEGGTSYARSLFTAIRPLGVNWCGQVEIGMADDLGLLRLAAESGCQTLLLGLESLSQDNLDGVGKRRSRVELYQRNIDRIHAQGISIIGCFVFGFDGEARSVFERTREFIMRNVDIPQLSLLTPFPGTRLFRDLSRSGRLLHRDWSRYDITHIVFQPARMTPREAEQGYSQLTRQVFSFRAMLDRAVRSGTRRIDPGPQDLTPGQRFASVLAPNLIYKRLMFIGR